MCEQTDPQSTHQKQMSITYLLTFCYQPSITTPLPLRLFYSVADDILAASPVSYLWHLHTRNSVCIFRVSKAHTHSSRQYWQRETGRYFIPFTSRTECTTYASCGVCQGWARDVKARDWDAHLPRPRLWLHQPRRDRDKTSVALEKWSRRWNTSFIDCINRPRCYLSRLLF